MTPKAGRYAAGAAAGLAVALSLTACKGAVDKGAASSGEGKPGGVRLTAAEEALAKVSSQTVGLTSYRGTISLSTRMSGAQAQIKGKMAVQLKPTMAVKFDAASATINGQKMQGFREVLVGDELYMKMPALAARTGKPWVGVSLGELDTTGGVDLKSMDEGNQGDPALNTRMLTASKDVRSVGMETIGGVSTTHYRGTLTMQEALAKLSGEQRAQAQKSLGEARIDKMAFDVWVDGRQLPRKVSMATLPSAKLDLKRTVTYTAFNVPLSITAPPKSQVADGSDLMGGGGANIPT